MWFCFCFFLLCFNFLCLGVLRRSIFSLFDNQTAVIFSFQLPKNTFLLRLDFYLFFFLMFVPSFCFILSTRFVFYIFPRLSPCFWFHSQQSCLTVHRTHLFHFILILSLWIILCKDTAREFPPTCEFRIMLQINYLLPSGFSFRFNFIFLFYQMI